MAAGGESGTLEKRKRSKKKKGCTLFPWCRRHLYLLLLLTCTIGGYLLGIGLQSLQLSNQTLYLIGFPGQLIFKAFLMIIVPLLFCSLVLGVSSLRKGGDTRMVALTIGFFLGLSTFAAIMGATIGHLVHPGQKITDVTSVPQEGRLTGRKGVILDSMLDLMWNSIPGNIIETTFAKEFTHVEILNTSVDNINMSVIYKKTLQQKRGTNFMGLLTFSILFGCALAVLGDKGEQLHQVIEQLNAVVMSIMGYFLNLLPVGMFFWMLQKGMQSEAPVELLGHLGVFLAAAFGCIIFHQFILLPLLYLCLVRKNPIPYHLNLLPAILTAFGTASSAATLPATVRCADYANRVNRCVSRFVLPLGMVVHMNGGTFYMPLSVLFMTQLEGIEIGLGETVIMCITSVLLLISAPATAGGGPVYFLTVAAAAGLESPQFLSVILSIDWLMERFRTVMNVVADSYVAAIVESLCRDRLPADEDAATGGDTSSAVIRGYDLEAVGRQQKEPTPCRTCGNVAGDL